MKRILTLLAVLMFLCSCDTINNVTKNQNERINEDLLVRWTINEKYDPMEKAVRTQEVPCYVDSDKVQCIGFIDDEEDLVGVEHRYTVDDTLMYVERSYKKNGLVYKTVTEYDRDFFDRFYDYDLPESLNYPFSRTVVCFGEINTLMMQPYISQSIYPDGSTETYYFMLTSEGSKLYLDHGEAYDSEGNLILMCRDEEESDREVYREEYEYADGVMTKKTIYDFKEGAATQITYENGVETGEESWKIDEYGFRIDEG